MQRPWSRAARDIHCLRETWIHAHPKIARRSIRISASTAESLDSSPPEVTSASIPDARFEVTGSPSSLLSVSLSASQYLYTRRGTLVGCAGKAENTVSTLSLLKPFTRAILRIPFLYQKIFSTTPITALIATNSANTAITVVHLDGRTDWMLGTSALLAWTGQTMSLRPTVDYRMRMAYWGHTEVTGRGLLALVGRGSISELELKEGETYIAHPGHVIAYSMNSHQPLPYRFKSSSFNLQIPNLLNLLPDIRFLRVMRQSDTWQALQRVLFTLRTWTRRTIWGDRLFLQFQGPTTLLVQSRTSKITDILTSRDLEDTADVDPGVSNSLVMRKSTEGKANAGLASSAAANSTPRMHTASVSKGGGVVFSPVKSSNK